MSDKLVDSKPGLRVVRLDATAQKKWVWAFVFVVGLYVASQLISNVLSLRIVMIGPFSIDAGSLLYPFLFTLRDLVHRVAGKQAARAAIFVAAAANALMVLLFWVAANMEADSAVGPQAEFGQVLVPALRLVVASIVVQVIAELIDTEIYHAWVRKFQDRHIWGRVVASNAVSVPIDSVLFALIAFYGTMPFGVVVSIIVSNILLKYIVTVISIPLIYTVKVPEQYRASIHLDD